jgi:hypothetical protein
MDEVQRMVDHARGHTELLNDMLVNSSGTTDDFERAMMRELVQGGWRRGEAAGAAAADDVHPLLGHACLAGSVWLDPTMPCCMLAWVPHARQVSYQGWWCQA